MRRMSTATAIAAALLALTQVSCSTSTVRPIVRSDEELISNGSFERSGQPTLDGWRITNPSVTTLELESAPGRGVWSLGLEADWAPTTGFVSAPIPGIHNGDVLRLSAYVRAVDADGGGAIELAVGPLLYGHGTRIKRASTTSTSWTLLSVQDTVSLTAGDTVWVALSSLHTEITRRQGRFDGVSLRRLQNLGSAGTE